MPPTSSDGGPPGGRRTALGVVVAAASPMAYWAVLVTGQQPVMLSTPADGGPPGGRRIAPAVVVPVASSVVYWAGPCRRVFLRHAIHSLRRGSARRSQISTGRRLCSGVPGHAPAWWLGGVGKRPRGAGLGGAGGWGVGAWRVWSGGWLGAPPLFALQQASKPPGRLLNFLCEAPCPHHLFVFRFCCVGLAGLVGGRPGFRGGSAASASPQLHFDP